MIRIIIEIISKGKMFWSLMKFSQLPYNSKFFKEMYGDKSGEFVFGYWSLTI